MIAGIISLFCLLNYFAIEPLKNSRIYCNNTWVKLNWYHLVFAASIYVDSIVYIFIINVLFLRNWEHKIAA